ncbi:ABC transporter ATP-binding protein [Bradyrhizobium lablabi]|uniref:Spermidine/putrescine import ATP-binding protein PotA n=2 Tax=Bradyrhizobium TaxID=374 RepID=A0ABY0PZF7_9BRAD|nr:putrescine transport system ATP-binding protein [Bradyrhizobium ottawaense]SEC88900.1 putrescine transport system ATP-binding protein [Bradyrhizobium lablabi]SHK97470.1 putrescine transport system ATP-binding protein [Bradyrhizobium lablabi]
MTEESPEIDAPKIELATAEVKPEPPAVVTADMPLLRIEGVGKSFGNFRAVDRLSLDIRAGEFFALLGPSGCGKTTLLRMLAGFETPDEGRILLDGKDIAQVAPHQRPVNMMFQNYALFPHLNVRDNIAFGLKRTAITKVEIAARVAEMVSLVKLEGMEKRRPDQLSGGQKQRVALARSLARRPQVLLLDEPLAALDKKLRESTQAELMELQRRLGTTFVIVTHDQEEAMTMANRIGVMDAGRLEQVAIPRELYEAPRSRWVAEFVGDINLFNGEVTSGDHNRLDVSTREAGALVVAAPRQPVTKATVSVAIRPEKVKLSRRGPVSDAVNSHAINRLDGVVTEVSYLGGLTVYKVKLDSGAVMRSSMANTARLDIDAYIAGQRVVAWFTPDDCVVLEQ